MSKTVEVRVRADHQPKSVRLTEWPMDDLGSVLRHISSWGFVDPDGSLREDGLFGQFVFTEDGEAYFEVVISSDEE